MSSEFNSRPLILIAGSAIYVVFTLVAFRALLNGDFIRFAMLAGIGGALLFNAFRKYWIGILLGVLATYSGGIGVPFLATMPPYFLITGVIAAYFSIEFAINKRPPMLRWRGVYAVFLLVALAITARVAYDRPGAANLGSGEGGLKKALEFIMAGYVFFVAYWATTRASSWKINLGIILVISGLCFLLVQVAFRYAIGGYADSVYGISFNWSLYPIYAALIVLSLSAGFRRLFSAVGFFLVSGFVLCMGAISQTRGAVLQVPLMIMSAAFIYRRTPLAAFTLITVGVVGFGALLTVVPYNRLPDNVRRPLSVFMGDAASESSYGTKDEWREGLHRYAWQKISANPLVGTGWKFDVGELVSAMSFGALAEAAQYGSGGGQLDMTGAFHNVFLQLAANNGLPVAVAAVAAIVIGMISLTLYGRRQTSEEKKAPIAFLVSYSSCVVIMYFFNGGSWDAFAISAALGTGFALRDMSEAKEAKGVPTATISTAPSNEQT